MNAPALFLSRYEPLRTLYLDKTWDRISAAHMRWQQPGLNSIAWNLLHIARVEDVGINRFVADRPQVLDEGAWLPRLGIGFRHQGTGQSAQEATATTGSVDLDVLRAYSTAVGDRTRAVVAGLTDRALAPTIASERIRAILFEEGFGHPNAAPALEKAYAGWSIGKCLVHFCLTHSYQHVGEIGVLASLQGLDAYGTP